MHCSQLLAGRAGCFVASYFRWHLGQLVPVRCMIACLKMQRQQLDEACRVLWPGVCGCSLCYGIVLCILFVAWLACCRRYLSSWLVVLASVTKAVRPGECACQCAVAAGVWCMRLHTVQLSCGCFHYCMAIVVSGSWPITGCSSQL